MKTILKIVLSVVLALILGVGSAVWAVNSNVERSWLNNGPWRVNLKIGSGEAGLYDKAAVARGGLFALNRAETVYFITGTDEGGEPLTAGRDYRIEGGDLATRWWSITLYGEDYFLVPNEAKRYSFSGNTVTRRPDGSYVIHISSKPRDENWLPNGGRDRFYLNLRLYNPEKSVYENPGSVKLPRIIREEGRS